MRLWLFTLMLGSALFAQQGSVHAHHSFAAEFDYDRLGDIEGRVIEVLFVNPHARYFVAVEASDGSEVIWDAQTRSPSALTRIGWSRDTIKLGDKVTLHGNLGIGNSRKIWIREVRFESGEIVYPTAEPSD
ncbi:MAG: DUF6152 family protein [Gammaproteobacteria bacterium]